MLKPDHTCNGADVDNVARPLLTRDRQHELIHKRMRRVLRVTTAPILSSRKRDGANLSTR